MEEHGRHEAAIDRAEPAQARQDAALVLRRLLDAVQSGELEAESAHARVLLRQLQGAVAGLEAEGE